MNYQPRPITGNKFIDTKDAIEVLNFADKSARVYTPRIMEMANDVLREGTSQEKSDMSEIIDDHMKNLKDTNTVVRWFLRESSKHAIMTQQVEDGFQVTYDNINNWMEAVSEQD